MLVVSKKKIGKVTNINNKLCIYGCYDKYIKVLNNYEEIIEKYKVDKNIYKITKNMNLI